MARQWMSSVLERLRGDIGYSLEQEGPASGTLYQDGGTPVRGIARALAVRPNFIVCDESVSALDVSVQAQVLNLLKDLKEEFGFTYIFISHDLSVVKFISDRIAEMKDGNIIETGISEEIYRSPENEYTKKLIESIPT